MRILWQSVVILFVPVLGCEGRTTTDTLPWSCNESCPVCPLALRPASLVGYWRFDDADLGGTWQGSIDASPRWTECDNDGNGDWVSGEAWPSACGTERLGGSGGSLRLAADGYVEAMLPESVASQSMTLAAWVSLLRTSVERMSVLSIVRPACASVWLDLQAVTGHHTMVLSVERSVPSSDQCAVDEWSADLPSGVFDWGEGNWYHVAAALDTGGAPRLSVDGEAVPVAATGQQLAAPRTVSALYIGADPSGGALFRGLVDDVAIFSEPLGETPLRDFVLDSSSVRSDGQSWMPWSADGSSVSWGSDCRLSPSAQSSDGAAVVIKNGYWSAGGLLARIDSGMQIGRLKKATLVADVPAGESFDFVLGSAHNAERCAWNTSGRGRDRYEFTLADVNNCDCPSSCDCTFLVDEARVGARWDEDGTLRLSTCRVELEWEQPAGGAGLELSPGPGGKQGLNGWCWRPVTYHPSASVTLDRELTNLERTVGTLRGGNRVTAYLAADFADDALGEAAKLCDLSEVTQITVEASMPEGFSYQFRIADYTGIAREWSRQWSAAEPVQQFTVCSSGGAEDVCGRDVDPVPSKHRAVNLKRIRYLGIQKTFELSSDEGEVSIDGVQFSGAVGGNCAIVLDPNIQGPQ